MPLISAPSVAAPHAQALLLYDLSGAAALERDPGALAKSLAHVLRAYPHFAGRLCLPPPEATSPPYTRRFLRPWLEYGHKDDPGFLLRVERRRAPLSTIAPAPTDVERVYNLAATNDFTLAPALAPNLSLTHGRTEDPVSGVKITLFDDGAAFVIGSSHVLCDAGALGTFSADWARLHNALSTPESAAHVEVMVESLAKERHFDSVELDALASGDLDADDEDADLARLESELDVLRYDAWARDSSGVQPPPVMDAKPHRAVELADTARGHRRGQTAPWETLGAEASKVYSFNFSAAEVARIAATVRKEAPDVSTNDAFAAHLWRLIARSRGQEHEEGPLEFTMACDSRSRLAVPQLDKPGCFNVCLGFLAPASSVLGDDGGAWASTRIRQAVKTVTPKRLGAWLHRRAHDLDFRREMICFPGTRSVCTTNWARSGVCTLDFGGGSPTFSHNLVMAFGGYATILRQGRGDGEGDEHAPEGRKWYEPGVDVMLWLEESAMDRLVGEQALRG